VRIFLGTDGYRIEIDDGDVRSVTIGDRVIRTDRFGEISLNFYGRQKERLIPVIRASDVIDGKVDRSAVEGKLVLLGTDTNLLYDYLPTPVGTIWGTEFVATAISNLLDGNGFFRPTFAAWIELGLGLFLSAVILPTALGLRPIFALLAALAAAAMVVVVIGALVVREGMLVSLTLPLVFGVSLYLQSSIMRFVVDERRSDFTRALSVDISRLSWPNRWPRIRRSSASRARRRRSPSSSPISGTSPRWRRP
jgi:CHASE2 domain-containing sensor protein